jgi:hypothetical protein
LLVLESQCDCFPADLTCRTEMSGLQVPSWPAIDDQLFYASSSA